MTRRNEMKNAATRTALVLGGMLMLGSAMAAPPEPFAKLGCAACHGIDNKIVGPSMKDVAAKYKDNQDAKAALTVSIKQGGSGKWGPIPMPPQPAAADADVAALVDWLVQGAP